MKLFDIQHGTTITSLPFPLDIPAICVAISSDGWLVTCSAGNNIFPWDLRSNHVIRNNVFSSITTVCLTENGLFASGDMDGLVMLWDPHKTHVIELGFHDDTITSVHCQGGLLASSDVGNTVQL